MVNINVDRRSMFLVVSKKLLPNAVDYYLQLIIFCGSNIDNAINTFAHHSINTQSMSWLLLPSALSTVRLSPIHVRSSTTFPVGRHRETQTNNVIQVKH